MSELSLPAGSLQGALQAFSGGADSVYLGLKAHSARKSAINFSLEQLSQLKQYAIKEDKKVYVALNTLLDDEELTTLVPTLRALQLLQVDGVIVQDLGLASLLREEYPSLALQSSTQLAVHTVEGVKALQQIGFSRIVLSRELTFAQIKEIRTLCPDVELK